MDGSISRLEGIILFAGIIAYTAFLIMQSRKEKKAKDAAAKDEFEAEFSEKPQGTAGVLKNIVFIAAGLVLLVIGSRWLVDGATAIARTIGVDDVVIGLTIVAAGTSLPEVATSILASIRGERDIAVGNVVGSNIFNILAVLGLSGIVAPAGLPVAASIQNFDTIVMIFVAIACLPIFFTGLEIKRWEGAIFIAVLRGLHRVSNLQCNKPCGLAGIQQHHDAVHRAHHRDHAHCHSCWRIPFSPASSRVNYGPLRP